DQKVASGFHRNQGHNTEGGIIPEEYRVEYVADRVHATATVFLGLSLQCARCHDHKYDPISQQEYYRFYGFFNSLDDKQGGYKGAAVIEPYVKLPTAEQEASLAALHAQQGDLERRIAQRKQDAETAFRRWEQETLPEDRAQFMSLPLRMHVPLD